MSPAIGAKICMGVWCCITAVCLAHSGFGCIAVVAHGGMLSFSGDYDMNLWKSGAEHSSGFCTHGIVAARDQGLLAGDSTLVDSRQPCESGSTHGWCG